MKDYHIQTPAQLKTALHSLRRDQKLSQSEFGRKVLDQTINEPAPGIRFGRIRTLEKLRRRIHVAVYKSNLETCALERFQSGRHQLVP